MGEGSSAFGEISRKWKSSQEYCGSGSNFIIFKLWLLFNNVNLHVCSNCGSITFRATFSFQAFSPMFSLSAATVGLPVGRNSGSVLKTGLPKFWYLPWQSGSSAVSREIFHQFSKCNNSACQNMSCSITGIPSLTLERSLFPFLPLNMAILSCLEEETYLLMMEEEGVCLAGEVWDCHGFISRKLR